MKNKLADDWWNQGLNPITGWKGAERQYNRKDVVSDEVKYYDAYPTLRREQ